MEEKLLLKGGKVLIKETGEKGTIVRVVDSCRVPWPYYILLDNFNGDIREQCFSLRELEILV